MKCVYVPILKCKKGEQKALQNLTTEVKERICPLIEIPFSSATTKKPLSELLESFWSNAPLYVYFMPQWYDNNLEQFFAMLNDNLVPLVEKSQYYIPVFDLSSLSYIPSFDSSIAKNGIAIRVRNNEMADINDVINFLINNSPLDRSQIDLILDLQYISENELFSKFAVLKSVFEDITEINKFHSVIIASTSFPKSLSSLSVGAIYRFKRLELNIHTHSLKLADKYHFNYCYSDYGPTDIESGTFIPGMSPNFKIKYTIYEYYLSLKGFPTKRDGLDIKNVQNLTQILVNSPDFCGENYSWGDSKIYALASKALSSPGNLTTWVSYAMNHHITFIANHL